MEVQVTINGITGQTPFDIYVCEVNGSGCFYISTITSFPYIFDIPAPYNVSPNYMVKAIDGNNCIISGTSNVQIQDYSVTPTNTSTPTQTPTQTPTLTTTTSQTPTPSVTTGLTPTPTETPTNTPSMTPTITSTQTQTPTQTRTPNVTPTQTRTPNVTPTRTPTRTPAPYSPPYGGGY